MERFRLAAMDEADEVLSLYRTAGALGRENGSSVWDDDYPNREVLMDDLAGGRLFVFEDDGLLLACVSLLEAEDIEAENLPWTPARACVPSRLCVAPGRQGEGLGEHVMRLLAARAGIAGCTSMRLLAARANLAANRLYERMGYRRVGFVRLYEIDFFAYELGLQG